MLIRNYGLFWRREWIHWGKGNNKGHLEGVLSSAKTGLRTDFRMQQGIYCLYDDGFRIVYIGQAGGGVKQRLFDRLKQHTRDPLSDRWTRFSWFGIRPVKANGELKAEKVGIPSAVDAVLNHIEGILIAALEPPHNRQGARFGEDVDRYLQYRDEANLGPDLAEAVMQIWRQREEEA